MKTIPISEAKANLPRLLNAVLKSNQSVRITRHGVPVARLVPERAFDGERTSALIAEIRSLRKGVRLGNVTVRQLRDEGRR